MNAATIEVTAQRVGARAVQVLAGVERHDGYQRLRGSSMRYSTCWATFTGYPLISEWDLDRDAGPLLIEALRVLALKAAVFELTGGDEAAAELLVAAPVDEMVHAVLAQATVLWRIQTDLGVVFPHATELERFDYSHGCATDEMYAAAGWGEPNRRYWLDAVQARRRLGVLNYHYQQAGFAAAGRSHGMRLAEPGSPELAGPELAGAAQRAG